MTVKKKVQKVEAFSNYLISPLRKRYDIFFRSTMGAFKALRCWLNAKMSNRTPKNWDKKRKEIDARILKFMRTPKKEATIEEINTNTMSEIVTMKGKMTNLR